MDWVLKKNLGIFIYRAASLALTKPNRRWVPRFPGPATTVLYGVLPTLEIRYDVRVHIHLHTYS